MDSAAPASRPKEMASDVLCGLLIACRARKVGEASQSCQRRTCRRCMPYRWNGIMFGFSTRVNTRVSNGIG